MRCWSGTPVDRFIMAAAGGSGMPGKEDPAGQNIGAYALSIGRVKAFRFSESGEEKGGFRPHGAIADGFLTD